MSNVAKANGARTAPLLISFFAHTSDAELALADLMSEGLSEQDFTLLKFGEGLGKGQYDALENVVEPFGNLRSSAVDQAEGSPSRESQVGGGIETTSPDDDVSAVEEMDDSESAAEDLMYPTSGRSMGDEDARDVQVVAQSGFFETTKREASHSRRAESTLTEIELPRVGLVIGEGSFGVELIEASVSGGSRGLPDLIHRYNSWFSVPMLSLDSGGAILAIDVEITGPVEDMATDILRARGARHVGIVDPRLR